MYINVGIDFFFLSQTHVPAPIYLYVYKKKHKLVSVLINCLLNRLYLEQENGYCVIFCQNYYQLIII